MSLPDAGSEQVRLHSLPKVPKRIRARSQTTLSTAAAPAAAAATTGNHWGKYLLPTLRRARQG